MDRKNYLNILERSFWYRNMEEMLRKNWMEILDFGKWNYIILTKIIILIEYNHFLINTFCQIEKKILNKNNDSIEKKINSLIWISFKIKFLIFL